MLDRHPVYHTYRTGSDHHVFECPYAAPALKMPHSCTMWRTPVHNPCTFVDVLPLSAFLAVYVHVVSLGLACAHNNMPCGRGDKVHMHMVIHNGVLHEPIVANWMQWKISVLEVGTLIKRWRHRPSRYSTELIHVLTRMKSQGIPELTLKIRNKRQSSIFMHLVRAYT